MTSVHVEPSRRERKRMLKTRLILDTALQLVVEGGIDALTIHAIARQLDWAVGATYRYFPSKDALFTALQCRVISEYRQDLFHLLERYEETQADPLGCLVLTACHYDHYLSRHPGHLRLISLALSDSKQHLPDELGLKVIVETYPVLERLGADFERAIRLGVLSAANASDRTFVYWTAVHGVLNMKKIERFQPEQFDNKRLFINTLISLFTGWGAPLEHIQNSFFLSQDWLS